MASQNVHEFTDANFQAEVLDSEVPVLVDFWAEWCMPCKMLAPTIDALAAQFQGRIKVGKLDTDANRNTAASFGISAIPTIMVFQKGELKHRWIGLQNKQDLADALGRLVAG